MKHGYRQLHQGAGAEELLPNRQEDRPEQRRRHRPGLIDQAYLRVFLLALVRGHCWIRVGSVLCAPGLCMVEWAYKDFRLGVHTKDAWHAWWS